MKIIPFNPNAGSNQSFQVLVESNEMLDVRLCWSERAQVWHMYFNGDSTLYGIKLVTDMPVLTEHRAMSPITGDIAVWPLVQNPSPLSFSNLGSEWGLVYLTAEEAKTWRSKNGIG